MDSSSSSDSEEEEYELHLSQLKTVLGGKPLFTEGYMLAKKDNVVPENPKKKGISGLQTDDNNAVEEKKK